MNGEQSPQCAAGGHEATTIDLEVEAIRPLALRRAEPALERGRALRRVVQIDPGEAHPGNRTRSQDGVAGHRVRREHPGEDPGRLRSPREGLAKSARRREIATADRDPVPVAADVQRDDATAERPHGPDDRRHLVDGVRDDVPAGTEPPTDEPIALTEEPIRLADGTRGSDEQVLDDEVELAAIVTQELEGVAHDQLDAQAVETEVAACEAHDLPVELDADDLGGRVQRAHRLPHAAGGEPEQQDAPAVRREKQDRAKRAPTRRRR